MSLPDTRGSSAATMMSWITTIVDEGIRRPGSGADDAVTAWAAEQLRALGMEVTLEPVPVPVWDFRSATLTAWSTARPDDVEVFEGFALPHTRTGNVEAPIAGWNGTDDMSGQIVVEQVDFASIPQSALRGAATSWHDPANEFDWLDQTIPFGPRAQLVADPAVEAGASGFVGVLSGLPWDSCDYYVPYDGRSRALHGIWLSRADATRLDSVLAPGDAIGRIEVDATARDGISHNIVATLSGSGDEWLIIGSHHDAPWASAVEDASGIALVLAQAHYWAGVPVEQRPHNLMFLLTAAHMVGGAGTRTFITDHLDLLPSVVAEIHLEHAAARAEPDGVGGLTVTDEPEVRWWFTSESPELQRTVQQAIERYDLRRSMVLPPAVFMEHPPTDGGAFHMYGVPLVDFLSAPVYLFDSADTVDKVHVASLEPVTDAVIDILTALGETTAAELRATVRTDSEQTRLAVIETEPWSAPVGT